MSELEDIHETLKEIKEELSHKSSPGEWLVVLFIFYFFFNGWAGSRLDRWTDRVWYSITRNADWNHIDISKRPSDCDFTHAPLGNKACHYKKSTIIFSDDERKEALAKAATDEERQEIQKRPNTVILLWEKKDD